MLEIAGLHKSFRQETVFRGLDLSLPAHRTMAILGRSGCGKTTLLKIVAGLLAPDGGEILLHGKRINDVKAEKRNIVYLYQETLLFPHLNIFENIAFGLRLKKEDESVVQRETTELLENLDLALHREKKPHELSGGQKQRVSFGRALIVNPALLLLDEPFGSLDVETRENMQTLLRTVMNRYKTTSIFVTHDAKEAILMGDQLGYMENGKIDIFESVQHFIRDPRTGVQKELGFWEAIRNGKDQTKL